MGRRGSRGVDVVRITESIFVLEGAGVARDVDRFATRRPKIVLIDLVQSSPRLRLRFRFQCVLSTLLSRLCNLIAPIAWNLDFDHKLLYGFDIGRSIAPIFKGLQRDGSRPDEVRGQNKIRVVAGAVICGKVEGQIGLKNIGRTKPWNPYVLYY
jgi:hypothetical protein